MTTMMGVIMMMIMVIIIIIVADTVVCPSVALCIVAKRYIYSKSV